LNFYILKRNQTYYYRIKIPVDLRSTFPVREIKQSLKTADPGAARILGSTVNTKVQTVFALIRSGALSESEVTAHIAELLPKKGQVGQKLNYRISELVELYIEDRSPHWTVDRHAKMTHLRG
jgi:hypothetical protein